MKAQADTESQPGSKRTRVCGTVSISGGIKTKMSYDLTHRPTMRLYSMASISGHNF